MTDWKAQATEHSWWEVVEPYDGIHCPVIYEGTEEECRMIADAAKTKQALEDLCYAVDELMCVLTETGADIDEETGLRYSDVAKVDKALERAEDLLAKGEES